LEHRHSCPPAACLPVGWKSVGRRRVCQGYGGQTFLSVEIGIGDVAKKIKFWFNRDYFTVNILLKEAEKDTLPSKGDWSSNYHGK
jgi:hypothetical protein